MTMEGAASCDTPRGVGTYASSQPATGPGIRRFRYTRDMSVNPFTYDDTNDPAQAAPHGIGSVWATVLWDFTCDLVDRDGFGELSDTVASGNGLALRLVSDGLKLQPCGPTMIDARDGILAADAALTGEANECLIWNTFARRGFGLLADGGAATSRFDQVEDFTVPDYCEIGHEIFHDGFEIGDASRWD